QRALRGFFTELQYEFEQRRDDAAIGRWDLHETRRLQPRSARRTLDIAAPTAAQLFGILLGIRPFEPRQMQSDDFGGQPQRIAQRALGEPVPFADWHDDD